MEKVEFTTAKTILDLQQILLLQKANQPKNLTEEEIKTQGFVTVEHNFDLLQKMNSPYPHIIAKLDNKVVGYALVMLPELKKEIPILWSLFKKIDELKVEEGDLKNLRYFVMGQICVDKNHRGQGVFGGLYQKMAETMRPHFDYIITEIAVRNTRSMRAHSREGFETLAIDKNAKEEWVVVGLKL